MRKQIIQSPRAEEKKQKTLVPVDGLKVGMYVSELDRPWLETPFILQGFEIRDTNDIEEIAKHCEFVYVDNAEFINLAAAKHTNSPSKKRRVTQVHKRKEQRQATITHNNASALTKSFMDEVRLGKAIDTKQVKKTISECVKSILNNPDTMVWLSKLRNKDEYTSQHCLNVAILAINLGRHLGAPEEALINLGICGVLHDVGKMRIPAETLNKEIEALTQEERAVISQHPVYGRDILLRQENLYHGAVDVAYAHHERLDGSGYPRQLKASGISDFTRIISVCEQYDSITNNREQEKSQSSQAALRYLYNNRGTKFDQRIVQQFIECIGLYPTGSIVELKNGALALVLGTNYRHRHLPKILVLTDRQKKRQPERIISLEKLAHERGINNMQLIAKVLPNGSYNIRLEEFIEKGLMIN